MIKHFRWYIVGLIAIATAINYLDRQNLPIALSEIKKSISITDMQYGTINSIFLFAYGTMYAVGGRILDITGSRIGYIIMIVWWSLANMMHGLVSGIMGLGIARLLLGAGEGGAFPASAKVVSEWFPAKERAFAFGIFNTGSGIGATVAPPLIAFIISFSNWRWPFIIFGLLGIIWAYVWWKLYSKPEKSRYATPEEKAYLHDSFKEEGRLGQAVTKTPWLSLFRYRQVWALLVIKFLTDAAWYFFIFWLPKYLNDIRGLDIKQIGIYAWVPYAFAACGSFFGGWLSSQLIKKGLSLDISRKIPLGIAAALLPASLLITSSSLNLCILFFSLAMLGHQAWSTILQTVVTDLFPSGMVGSVAGLAGAVGTYGAMLFSIFISFIVTHYGYEPAFIISGLLHPIGYLLIFIMIKKIKQVRIEPISQPKQETA